MKNTMNLDPTNDSHWTSHIELTKAGAPRPALSSPRWNEWAANNPTPQTVALACFDIVTPLMQTAHALVRGARPCDVEPPQQDSVVNLHNNKFTR